MMTDTTTWHPGDLAEMHSDEPSPDLHEGDPVTVVEVGSDPGPVFANVWVHIRTEDGRDFTTDPDEIRPRKS